MNNKYITRTGWSYWVRIPKKDGGLYQKSFCGSKYTGPLSAAREWRDEILKKHPVTWVGRNMRNRYVTNTSGFVGVSIDRTVKPAGIYYAWRCAFKKEGRYKYRNFNMRIYGYIGGYVEAVKLRCRFTDFPLPDPMEPPDPDLELRNWLIANDVYGI